MTGITAISKAEFCLCFIRRCRINPPLLVTVHTYTEARSPSPLQTEAGWGRRVTHGLGLSWPLYCKHFSGPAECLQKFHTLGNNYTIPAVMRFSTPETWEVWRDLQTTTASQHCKPNTRLTQARRAYSRSTSLPSNLLSFHSLYNSLQAFPSPLQQPTLSCVLHWMVWVGIVCHLPALKAQWEHIGAWLTWSGNHLQCTYTAASGSLWLSQFQWLDHTKLQFTCNFPPKPQQNQKSFWLRQAAGQKLTKSKHDWASCTPLTNYEAISSEVQNSTNGG